MDAIAFYEAQKALENAEAWYHAIRACLTISAVALSTIALCSVVNTVLNIIKAKKESQVEHQAQKVAR